MLLEHAEQSLTVLPGEIPPSPVPREGVHVDVVEKELSHGVEEVLSVLKVSIDGHGVDAKMLAELAHGEGDRKSTRLNSSHVAISYAVFCLKKKKVDKK